MEMNKKKKKKEACAPRCGNCGCAPKKDGQNGKGDAPRNISAGFRENYSSINWSKKKS
jgi:hypothetical protein